MERGLDKMRLTAKLAIEFATMNAQLKAMKETRDFLAKEIKDEMCYRKFDEFAPGSSPYKLVKTEYDKTAADYKDMAMRAYQQLYGDDWSAKFEADAASYGEDHIIELEPKPNENWVGGLKMVKA